MRFAGRITGTSGHRDLLEFITFSNHEIIIDGPMDDFMFTDPLTGRQIRPKEKA